MATATSSDVLVTRDGLALKQRRWRAVGRVRGSILIVHGLGEHSGRYQRLAMHLTKEGWNVAAYDLRGHGESEGRRGHIRSLEDHLDDLGLVMDAVRSSRPGAPLILLGHSMGGQIAALMLARAYRPANGLILSSPALMVDMTPVQRLQLVVGGALTPNLGVKNGLPVDKLSHSQAVVTAYRNDPLVHDIVTPRLARSVVRGGAEVLRKAKEWKVPTLLLWAGDDHCVNPSGSARFALQAPQHVVRSKSFPGLYHEIFNERHPEPVLDALDAWLEERYPRI